MVTVYCKNCKHYKRFRKPRDMNGAYAICDRFSRKDVELIVYKDGLCSEFVEQPSGVCAKPERKEVVMGKNCGGKKQCGGGKCSK